MLDAQPYCAVHVRLLLVCNASCNTHPTTRGSWPCTLKGVVRVGWCAQAKLDMVAKPLRAGRILRGLFSDRARERTSWMAFESSSVDVGVMSTSAAQVTCSCRLKQQHGNSRARLLQWLHHLGMRCHAVPDIIESDVCSLHSRSALNLGSSTWMGANSKSPPHIKV